MTFYTFFQGEAVKQKQKAFEEFKQRRYEKSLRLFRLALMLHPTGSSNWVKFKRSNKSHQATAYFKLQKYVEALEIGEQSYMSDKTMNAVSSSSVINNDNDNDNNNDMNP